MFFLNFKNLGLLFLSFAFAVVATVNSAMAEAKAHGSEGFSALIPYWINFILFVAMLYFILRKPAPLFWVQRREKIADAIEKAAAELRQAEAKLRQARENFDNVEEEGAKVKELLRNDAIAEHDAIIAEAKAKAELVIQRAKETAEAEKTSAMQALRSEMAERVIQRARQGLLERLSPASDYGRRQLTLGAFKRMLH